MRGISLETIIAYGKDLIQTVIDPSVRYSAFYLACTLVLAVIIWLARGRPKAFLSWLLPREVYRHRSNILDIKLFLTNRLMGVLGVFGAVVFIPAVAFATLRLLAGEAPDPADLAPANWQRSLLATIVIVMTSDFCVYWSHRIQHEWKILWPFHAVHHSAPVLTPLTVTRTHPVEIVIRNLVISALVGVVQALILFALMGQIDLLTIGGANAVHFLFNTLGSNFRHSHIWVSYGRVLEHILISPAQHQIHHSSAPEHHDKNYGSIFAIWDWMFGTLYVPPGHETLTFGITDSQGNLIEEPHPTLQAALLNPFAESWAAIRRRLGLNRVRPPSSAAATMTPGLSLWLDCLRAGAALVVLFGHLAHTRFTGGDYAFLREINIASDAVIVFFVLSGLVIAYAAERDGSLDRFAFNRLTRILSVVAPALVLTWVFDAIGTRTDMSAYPYVFYQPVPAGEFFLRGLSFSNQWLGLMEPVRLGSNGPLWSLSYEVAFYALFGVAIFLRGALRVVLLALVAVVVGLPVLLLLPAWLLGVAVWRLGAGAQGGDPARDWAMAILPILALVALKAAGVWHDLNALTAQWFAPVDHRDLLLYSDEFLWNTVMAVAIAAHLTGVRRIAAHSHRRFDGRGAAAIRWVAGASFSIYVVHYPTLHLLDAALPGSLPGHDLIMLAGTLAVCLVFAALFERPLGRVRAMVRPGWTAAAGLLGPRKVAQTE